jgi:hypothetical protein
MPMALEKGASIWERILEYRRFIRDEVGDSSDPVAWPSGLMGSSPLDP